MPLLQLDLTGAGSWHLEDGGDGRSRSKSSDFRARARSREAVGDSDTWWGRRRLAWASIHAELEGNGTTGGHRHFAGLLEETTAARLPLKTPCREVTAIFLPAPVWMVLGWLLNLPAVSFNLLFLWATFVKCPLCQFSLECWLSFE
jgi:hypothetical protein